MTADKAEVLRAYDDQLRTRTADGPGVSVTRDGPFVRTDYGHSSGLAWAGSQPPDLVADDLVRLLVEQRDRYDRELEWKTHSHVESPQMLAALDAAGFRAQERETVVVADAVAVAGRFPAPAGVSLRRATARPDFEAIARMEAEVWDEDWSFLADELYRRVTEAPESIEVWVAEGDGQVVSAAWVTFTAGTDFAGLWGGSTLPAWRRRGIYRALVSVRAETAVERGFRYLQVDASDDSRPILEALGFVAITTTTPYVHKP